MLLDYLSAERRRGKDCRGKAEKLKVGYPIPSGGLVTHLSLKERAMRQTGREEQGIEKNGGSGSKTLISEIRVILSYGVVNAKISVG